MKKFILILLAFTLTGCTKKSSFDLSSLRIYDVPLDEKFRAAAHLKYPYTASFKVKDKELMYIASYHSHTLTSPALTLVKESIENFKPDIIIIEGLEIAEGVSPARVINRVKDTCLPNWNTCHEMLYAAYLGALNNIPFSGSEASDKYIFKELESRGYSAKDIAFFYLTRQLPQYYEEKKITSWQDLERDFPTLLQIPKNFERLDYTWAEYTQWLKENVSPTVEFKKLIAPESPYYTDPKDKSPYLVQITNANILMRDKHIVHVILDHMLYRPKYKKILVILGFAHYFTQKDVLAKYLGTPVYKNYDF